MQITYLFNSGFAVVMDNRLMVFDCVSTAPTGSKGLPDGIVSAQDISRFDEVLVFVSHRHGDHFTPAIFAWRQAKADIHYILSSDLSAGRAGVFPPGAHFLGSGDTLRVADAEIRAFGSTDEGVSFLVSCGGRTLFHAGDLNLWHWQDESAEEEVALATLAFNAELENLARFAPPVDVAFFPVDPRMGTDYARGAEQFIERMKPKLFVPMHFGASASRIEAFYRLAKERAYPVARVEHSGQMIKFE